MHRYARLWTLPLLIASLGTSISACGWGPSEWPPEGVHTLSGTVTEMTPAGVVPVQRLVVIGPRGGYTWTDSAGRYRFSRVPPGTTSIRVEAGPFEPVTRTVSVSADSVIDLQLVRRPRFTLSGLVTEATADGPVPLAGVDVEVELCPPQMSGGSAFSSARTDAQGFYHVADMCDGRVIAYALKAGYTFADADGCDDGHFGECRWITIAGDTRFDFRMTRRQTGEDVRR
jgi:hypothetical protein